MQAEIDLFRPRTLGEALAQLSEHAPQGNPLAGGTNLVVEMRVGRHQGKSMVDLGRLKELRGIQAQNGHIVIGGGTTVSELLKHPLIADHAVPLCQSAAVFANPLIRNRATVAGNLVDASPAADLAPPLLALGAEVELVSREHTRWVSLDEFMVGVRKTLIQPDELMRSIRWSKPPKRSAGAFYKVGLRKADAISVLSAAVMVACDTSGRCKLARIALGALAPRPLRAYEAEDVLQGQPLQAEGIAEAARLAAEAARPISDIRGTAEYRKRVTEVIVRRLLVQASEALEHP
ncbi:MAG: xanthine dehydrogenase family protein subunit M [Anaerolineales bacterium]|nr:xanthine dehydrogenase family protein subunit M [Anaerolineales bacterium]